MKNKIMAVLLCLAAPASAGSGVQPFSFLQLDGSARAVGLGGAYTALATDANALLYNPAGLGMLTRHEATFMHSKHVEDVTQEYAAVATRQGFGASVNYLRFGSVRRTTLSNPDGAGLGSADAGDLAVSLGYGRTVFEGLALGVSGKFIRQALDDVEGRAFAADAGALYRLSGLPLTFGLAAQNMGPSATFEGASERLPLAVRFGSAYQLKALGAPTVLALEGSKTRGETPVLGAGVETLLAGAMAVRLGYSGRNDSGPGVVAGVGYWSRSFGLDYAFTPFGGLGDSHRASVTLRWGGAPPTPVAGAEQPFFGE